jgi:hypothetical protein
VKLGIEVERLLLGRGRRAPVLFEPLDVRLQRTRESLGTGEQSLLQADEGEAAVTRSGGAELGVARELGGEGQLDGLTATEVHRAARALGPRFGVVRAADGLPSRAVVLERDLNEETLGEAVDAECAQVALQAADHDGLEVFLALNRDAAREAHGIEDLEKRAEAVRVPVVWGGAQKKAVVEARRQVADGARDVRVGRVLAR